MKALALAALLLLGACAGAHLTAGIGNAPSPVPDGLPLGALPKQDLKPGECAIFLWKTGEGARLLLVAWPDPPRARILLDGKPVDLPRLPAAAGAAPVQGQDPHARYGDGAITLTLDLTIEARAGLTDGAVIPSGSLAFGRQNGESIVVPVRGLLGCRPV